MSSDGLGWDFIQTLEHEVGLDRDTAERVEAVINDSGFYLTHDEHYKECDRLEVQMGEREDRIEELEQDVDELKDILDQIKALVTSA